jgi:hypothetical protein
MKYRLYVNGKCKNYRSFQSNIGIGGVILNDYGDETSFSRNVGTGTCCEAQIYAILYGIDIISKSKDAESVTVYISNLMLVDYLNEKHIDISASTEMLVDKLKIFIKSLKLNVNFEYFDVSEYSYVRSLAEDAIEL